VVPPDPELQPEVVAAYDFEDPDRPTFVDANRLTSYHLFMNAFACEDIMLSIRHPKWPTEEFFLTCLLSSPDGRWFARGGPGPSRAEWQSHARRDPSSALTTLARIRPEQAAELLLRAKFELPADLAAMVTKIASEKSTGSEETGPASPGPVEGSPLAMAQENPGASRPSTNDKAGHEQTGIPRLPTALTELAHVIRSNHPHQRNVPRFLELIALERVVSFDRIAEDVHEYPLACDSAIEKTVSGARKAIAEAVLPFNIRISDRKVYRVDLPA
jgi:hypothetical protein